MYGRKKFSINSWDRNRSRKHFSKNFSVAVNPTTMYPIGKKKECEDLDPGWNHVWIQIGEETSRIRKIGPTAPEKGSNAI
jgi:hypothetical protein